MVHEASTLLTKSAHTSSQKDPHSGGMAKDAKRQLSEEDGNLTDLIKENLAIRETQGNSTTECCFVHIKWTRSRRQHSVLGCSETSTSNCYLGDAELQAS